MPGSRSPRLLGKVWYVGSRPPRGCGMLALGPVTFPRYTDPSKARRRFAACLLALSIASILHVARICKIKVPEWCRPWDQTHRVTLPALGSPLTARS